jgi:hypothetical protein
VVAVLQDNQINLTLLAVLELQVVVEVVVLKAEQVVLVVLA